MRMSACGASRAVLGLLATLTACVAQTVNQPAPVDASPLEGTHWTLVEAAGQGPVANSDATLGFESGRVQGTDGCNRYSGPYAQTGSALRIGPNLASTRMACPPEVMARADAFMKALIETRSLLVRDGELQLLAEDGKPLARFKGAPTPVRAGPPIATSAMPHS
jgi:heat shock protein HslJ